MSQDSPYTSPLMKKLQNGETLSLVVLAREVPLVHAGKSAQAELDSGVDDRIHRRQLLRTIQQGERAKERLVGIALPLIRSLAYKEFKRRQAWNSRVSLEDIISEGIGGFLRGINAYNPEGKHKSPTNYLGQWILTDMRRNVEELEHDFSIPFEAMERQRKIRAIRSRLTSEMGREPTDEEIIEAANSQTGYGDNMLGRVDKKPTNTPPPRRRLLTQKHIDEEREMARRTGALPSTQMVTDDGGTFSTMEVAEARSITDNETTAHGVEGLEKAAVQEAHQRLLEDSFSLLDLGQVQRDIIRRKFGLQPYLEEQTLKDIALTTGVQKHKVTKIINLFSREMSTPHGVFHQLISRMDIDDVEAIGMGAVLSALGTYDPTVPRKSVHRDLTSAFATQNVDEIFGDDQFSDSHSNHVGVQAVYKCDKGDPRVHRLYESEDKVPSTIRCPRCNRAIPRVRS